MAETFLPAQQAKPSPGTLTTLYTNPAAVLATIFSSIVVANQSSSPDYFRLSIGVAGAADASSQYLAYDTLVLPNDMVAWTGGAVTAPNDVLRCQSRNGNLSFNAFPLQIT